MSKRVDQLDAISAAQAKNNAWLIPQCDPVTGISKKMTVEQAKEVYATKRLKYVATGSEGATLTIPSLAGYEILLIMREGGPIYEVGSSPDSSEFTWDDTDIVLGAAVNMAGERFLILYRTY
jgi:hypothetical protein